MPVLLKQRLLTTDEYHKMAVAGILKSEDRVELLNGQIIYMSPIGSAHAACVEKMGDLLRRLTAGNAMVRTQNPITLSDISEPEPDIALVALKTDYYTERHPVPGEIFLVVEVADSTLEKDRIAKLPLYAEAAIPEYWIVNLEKRELEAYSLPTGSRYSRKTVYSRNQELLLEPFGVSVPLSFVF
jgi:Uma2 family endonuclease